jgi:hypothetical protein
MKTAGIYINVDNLKNDQDDCIADLLYKCYELESKYKFVILDSYIDTNGKYDERNRLVTDIKNNEINTVITNDPKIDEILTNFILVN